MVVVLYVYVHILMHLMCLEPAVSSTEKTTMTYKTHLAHTESEKKKTAVKAAQTPVQNKATKVAQAQSGHPNASLNPQLLKTLWTLHHQGTWIMVQVHVFPFCKM
jgi:hypothetical protein